MNFKAYYFFIVPSIVGSYLLSIEKVNTELDMFVKNMIFENYNGSTRVGIFHDDGALGTLNLLKYFESLYIPVLIHDLNTPELMYNSSDVWIPAKIVTPTQNNVIILKDSEDLRSILQIAKTIPYFSARSNVLVIFTETINFTEQWVHEIFSELWKIYILNVGLIFYDDKVQLFTYVPWSAPFEIQNLTDEGFTANIFYDKLKNLKKYPIKILHHPSNMKMITVSENNSTTYLGVDGMTMSTIIEHHNATGIVIVSESDTPLPCRFIHRNYTIEGLFGADENNESIDICPYSLRLPAGMKKPTELAIIKYNTDINFDSRPLRSDMDYRVDSTHFQQMDSYCIMIPAKIRIPQAFNLLKPLQYYVWISVVLSFILQTVTHFVIQTFNGTHRNDFFHTCFTLYRIQVNNAPSKSGKLNTSGKVHLLCWVLYCFIMSASYQSDLISSITVPLFFTPINCLQELKGIDIPILTHARILTDMPNVIDMEASQIILEKVVLNVWNNERKFDTKKGYLVPESTARYILQRKDLLDEDGTSMFHLMDECPMPVFTTYQMPRGSPLLEIVNKFTPRKIESGLTKVWEEESRRYLNSQLPTHSEDSEEHIILTPSHLQGVFYILIIGQILATCVFLCELHWKKIRKFTHMKSLC